MSEEFPTLASWHMKHSLKVTTTGTGRSYVVVPYGEDLSGHMETVKQLCTIPGWTVHFNSKHLLVPTYAYDRVVVAGLRCEV